MIDGVELTVEFAPTYLKERQDWAGPGCDMAGIEREERFQFWRLEALCNHGCSTNPRMLP